MKRIGDFTAKYGGIERNTRSTVSLVQKSIEIVIDVQVPTKSIKVNDGIVYIQTHPAIKQVILAEKNKIIENFKKEGLKINQIR